MPTLSDRTAGALLHLTSLPGAHGVGDLGHEAREFADFLAAAGMRWWQVLPVGPVGYGSSPYSALSAFAGSPLLIDLDELVLEGLLPRLTIALPEGRVDYELAWRRKEPMLRQASAAAYRDPRRREAMDTFAAGSPWLDDWTLFAALKARFDQKSWVSWPADVRGRDPSTLAAARKELADDIRFHRFVQATFARQWTALRRDVAARGVGLIGDLPIFVAHDSADVWAAPELFTVGSDGQPTLISGVPPDYFSKTGQRWGNPLYRWDRMAEDGFSWWTARMRQMLDRFDVVRLDHFIGFQNYWAIPASEPTAEIGTWEPGPRAAFFEALAAALGSPLPLIAEDLGVMTPAVAALRDRFGLPGLRILQFAFGTDPSAPTFLPHNYVRNTVVYTGTHDNDTVVGWYRDEGGTSRSPEQVAIERDYARRYLRSDGREIHWDMLTAAVSSVGNVVIAPVQDLLGLGTESRMNTPGVATGNWQWRLLPHQLDAGLAARVAELLTLYGRRETA